MIKKHKEKKTEKLIFALFFISSFLILELYPLQKKSFTTLEDQYSQYYKEGKNFRLNGEFQNAIELFEKSLNIAKKIPDKEKECSTLLKLGLMYWNIGRLKESSEFYKNALSLAQKLNLKNEQEESQNALKIYVFYSEGKKYRSSGQYQESIKSFQKAVNLAKKIGSKEHEVKCLRQFSITYWNSNNLQKFKSLNEEALDIARSLKHRKAEGRCLNNIGLYYWRLYNYSKALIYYEGALTIIQDLKNKKDEADCLNKIGFTYRNIGNYDKSLDYLIRAHKKAQEIEDDNLISMALNSIGNTFRDKGLLSGKKEDFYKAISYYEDSLRLAKKYHDIRLEIEVLNNIGSVNSDLENYYEALKYYQQGYKKAEEINDIEAKGMLLNNMGIVHFNQGNYEESTKFYQKAIDLALEIEGGHILWEAYLEIANAYAKQDKAAEALENYKNSISITEDIRSQIKLEEFRASYLGTDKRIEAYYNLIHLLYNLHKNNTDKAYDIEAFNYLERAKARAFLDSLELSQVNISRGIDFKLQNQEKEIMKDISNIYNKLFTAKLSPEEKKKIQEQLIDKENELETLKREIRTKSPVYANLKYPEAITLEETQKELLDAKTAFFAYSIGRENSYAFVITKKDLSIFPLPSKDRIQSLVTDYKKIITDKENQNFQPGYELFRALVLPGLDKNTKKIIFIPDDILHSLPFETLVTHEKRKHWLIEDYKIAYAPSISSLREIIERKKSNSTKRHMDILALGDPDFGSLEKENIGNNMLQNFFSSNDFSFFRLKYSGTEIKRISSLFKKTKSKVIQRENATEERLKKHDLKDYKIIHFATHSIIDDERPARSFIVLSLDNDPEEDGFLQMREIYNLNLNSDLVTLSACQTGLGRLTKGEGIEGINRAFFFAGSSSVLMSLWAVNDQATYQLMERFYTHLRSSESIMDGLRKAKLEMIDSDVLSHPYYWAGFVISGKAAQIIFPNYINRWLLLGSSFLLLGSLILIAIKRNGFTAHKP